MNRDKVHFGYLFAGVATLVSVSFLDNIRGPLLPVICDKLGLSYSYGGIFLTIGNFAAVLSTLAMGQALKRVSERKVTLFICLFCSLPGLIAPFTNNLIRLLLLGLVMGAAVALMGSICNILTIKGSPLHLRGRLLSIQQMTYGIGSFLGPVAFAFFFKREFPWWSAILLMSVVNLILAATIAKVVPEEPVANTNESLNSNVSFRLMLPVVLFAIYVGGEVLTSMWMSTFFLKVAGLSNIEASHLTSLFFVAISGSRLLSFLFLRPKWERTAMIASLLAGIIFLILALHGHPKFLPLAGLMGPFFPLFMAQVSRVFPEQWKSMTIWIFAAIQTSLGIIHLSVGNLADAIGIHNAFHLAPGMIVISLLLTALFFKKNPVNIDR